MNTSLDQLAQLLRNELLHHGGLLALLEQPPAAGSQRWIEALLPATEVLEEQCQALQQARQSRVAWQAELAGRAGLARQVPLAELIPHLPCAYRPLLETLAEEIGAARERILARLQQNHRVLSHCVTVLNGLLPAFDATAAHRLNTDRLDCCPQDSAPVLLELPAAGLSSPQW